MSIQTIANRNTNEITVQTNWRLPKALLGDLKQICSEAEISQTLVVREAIREKINQYRQDGKITLSLEK